MGRRWASRTLNLKQIGTDSGVFPQFQTAVCFFQQQLPVAAGGFPVTLFQDPLSSFVIALYPFKGLRTVALFEVQRTVCACWEPLGFAPRPVAVSEGRAREACPDPACHYDILTEHSPCLRRSVGRSVRDMIPCGSNKEFQRA